MITFTLTHQHIALLRRANVGWNESEFGAPAIDPKRPYGNGDALSNLAEILGEPPVTCPHCEEPLPLGENREQSLHKIHRETEMALQVVLVTGRFEPGVYVADDYRRNWRSAR